MKNAEQINQDYHALLKDIVEWFREFLKQNDENNKFNCWFELETSDTFGLSSLEIPHIDKVWMTKNGCIAYHIDHTEEDEWNTLQELDLHNIILLMLEIQ